MVDGFVRAFEQRDITGSLTRGDAGVGKTRLADECLRAAEQVGAPIGRAIASETSAPMPLGAIAQLLADPTGAGRAATGDPIALFEHARTVLTDPGGRHRYVLFVDDVNLLDATSAVLVAQLLAAGVVFLVATMRTGATAPDLITSLWRDHRVERLDLAPLDRNGIDTLLHLVLGGPLDTASSLALWDACRGNALLLHELVLGAIEAGTLRADDG